MTNSNLFKSPAQAYKDATSEVTAYKVGVALRIVWEVTKHLAKWAVLIAAAVAVGGAYFLWRLVFGTMNK